MKFLHLKRAAITFSLLRPYSHLFLSSERAEQCFTYRRAVAAALKAPHKPLPSVKRPFLLKRTSVTQKNKNKKKNPMVIHLVHILKNPSQASVNPVVPSTKSYKAVAFKSLLAGFRIHNSRP